MNQNIPILLLCVPLYVINSFCDKLVSAISNNRYNTVYNGMKFLVCAACAIPMLWVGAPLVFGVGSLACGCICGLLYAVSKTVMLKGYEATTVAFMTLCHSAGMIVPCILGHFLWSETLSVVSAFGIGVTILAILLLKAGKKEEKGLHAKGVLYGVVIFLTSAGVMVTQKAMGIYFVGDNVALYNFYSFLVAAGILCLFIRPARDRHSPKKEKRIVGACALGSGVCLAVIGFVMTTLASGVPSVILFPLFNGSGILAVCIGSVFVFGEALNAKQTAGLLLGVCGLCLVNL